MSNIESYPPVLRHLKSEEDDSPAEETGLIRDKDMAIPVMDLENLDMEKLEEACRDWGIFRLDNHGIPLSLTRQLQEVSKELFRLPFETKQTLFGSSSPPLSYFWGTPALTPSGTALHEGTAQNINLVEGVNVPLSSLSKLRLRGDQGRRRHHHLKLESFRVLTEEYGTHLTRVAVAIFEAIADTLNLEPRNQRSKYLSEPTGFVRFYRYPSCSSGAATAAGVWGMDVHTDSSLISILNQDKVGGLEFMKDGEWYHIQPVPNTLIVNLGDMMQATSDDKYKSVEHRVGLTKEERHSICYFVFPDKDCVINSSHYRPFTYSDFQAQVQLDIRNLGSKVGLPRFKIV